MRQVVREAGKRKGTRFRCHSWIRAEESTLENDKAPRDLYLLHEIVGKITVMIWDGFMCHGDATKTQHNCSVVRSVVCGYGKCTRIPLSRRRKKTFNYNLLKDPSTTQREVEAVKNVATKEILTLVICVKCNSHRRFSFYVPELMLLLCVLFRILKK
jgi:hypothetical protein